VEGRSRHMGLHATSLHRLPRLAAASPNGAMTSLEDYARELQRSEADGVATSAKKSRGSGWRSRVRKPLVDVCTVYLVLKHAKAPIAAKGVAAVTVGYMLSPIQLIPSFIPVIGWMDDLAVLWLGTKMLRTLTPDAILVECRANAGGMATRLLQRDAKPPVADTSPKAVSPTSLI
jgi:uncharacterized membrane protein YkvA (DUF1232 family)